MVKPPSKFRHTEQQVNQRTGRKQQVADNEILTVQYISATDQMQIAPDIIAEYTRETCDQNDESIDDRCFFSAKRLRFRAKHVNAE